MRLTLIGHASVLVETAEATYLMDPVFGETFEGGAVTSCPAREVDLKQLPEIDYLILSHRHPDHFDIPSVARLPRSCTVLCPRDAQILYALERLGFTRVRPIEPMRPLPSFATQLYATRSEDVAVPEFGMIFADASGTVWNQVDTVLSFETIREALARFPTIDLLLARYASQNFEFFESRATTFPHEEHQRNLETVLLIRARAVVPGSAGFRFCAEHAWLNRYLFPVSRERFADDLRRLAPSIEVVFLNPGDVVEIDGGSVTVQGGASPFCRTLQVDTDAIRFDPTAPIPPLQDPNPGHLSQATMEGVIRPFIEDLLYGYARTASGDRLDLPARYRLCDVLYEVEVVFPEQSLRWQLDFRGPEVTLTMGGGVEPTVVHRITGSALADWIRRRRGYFYTRAYSRRYSTLSRVFGDEAGVEVRPVSLPDLLIHFLLNVAPDSAGAARQRLDQEIEAALAS
ncbi:MAG: MBL fold metallo-hydrolase [Deltaproteobacteria bacterium]|nr:MBL fold metallo-hydrolase [Deltaproteobacteria bacterium]